MNLRRLASRWLLPPLLCGHALAQTVAQAPASCPPQAQQPTAGQLQAGMRDARDHGFLWRISKNGHDSYLYGTVHVAKLEWAFPGPAVQQALEASDTVALELDMLDPDVQRRMGDAIKAQAGESLPEPLQRRLDRLASAECVPAAVLAPLVPELQVATLMTLIARRDGLDPSWGIDIVLAGWGRRAKMPVVSLETPELQLKTLQLESRKEMLEFVGSALDELESGRARPALRRIAQVWADSDLEALDHYESWCDCVKTEADRAAMVRMVDDRNPALAASIEALHAEGKSVFAAVGSLHMTGALGLPALMAARGFQVERVAYRR
jgi:uncharacterized protein